MSSSQNNKDAIAQEWEAKVGPFLSAVVASERFNISLYELTSNAAAKLILSVKTGDGTVLFPEFQFTGASFEQLQKVLKAMDPHDIDPWGCALWLTAARSDLEGLSPWQALDTALENKVFSLAQDIGSAY
jgi:hypothetical protein